MLVILLIQFRKSMNSTSNGLPAFVRISVVLVVFWNSNCLNRKIRANKNKYPELSQRSISMMRYWWRNNSKCHILCWNFSVNFSVHEINNTSHSDSNPIWIQRYCSSKYLIVHHAHSGRFDSRVNSPGKYHAKYFVSYFRDSSPRILLENAKQEEKTEW